MCPTISTETSPDITEIIEHREQHLEVLKQRLLTAQNRMKLQADKKRTERVFTVGDKVLLKLQPYTQSSVASKPYPKLAYKYFGPYTVLERIGSVAYKLELPEGSQVHPVFHISQLKQYHPDHSPVFSNLPMLSDIQASSAQPLAILDRRLVKKGNTAIPQVLLSWTGLPTSATTWEDYYVVKTRFPDAPA